VDIKILSRLF